MFSMKFEGVYLSTELLKYQTHIILYSIDNMNEIVQDSRRKGERSGTKISVSDPEAFYGVGQIHQPQDFAKGYIRKSLKPC
jgi:hypothetical protein